MKDADTLAQDNSLLTSALVEETFRVDELTAELARSRDELLVQKDKVNELSERLGYVEYLNHNLTINNQALRRTVHVLKACSENPCKRCVVDSEIERGDKLNARVTMLEQLVGRLRKATRYDDAYVAGLKYDGLMAKHRAFKEHDIRLRVLRETCPDDYEYYSKKIEQARRISEGYLLRARRVYKNGQD